MCAWTRANDHVAGDSQIPKSAVTPSSKKIILRFGNLLEINTGTLHHQTANDGQALLDSIFRKSDSIRIWIQPSKKIDSIRFKFWWSRNERATRFARIWRPPFLREVTIFMGLRRLNNHTRIHDKIRLERSKLWWFQTFRFDSTFDYFENYDSIRES